MVHKHGVAVVVDSSSCLPPELLKKWNIRVVPHELMIGGRAYGDGVDIKPTEFYEILQSNNKSLSTSSPKPASFIDAFHAAGQDAESILCLTVSAGFSATFRSASMAAQAVEEEMPEMPIKVVDSQAAAGAEGLIALVAARAAQEGADLDGVLSRIEEIIPRVNLLAFLHTLDYLRRSGRVPRIAAWAGSLLGIKPLTELKLGEARVIGKPRTRARATERLIEVMKARVEDRLVHVNVMHAHAADDAEALRNRVQSDFNCSELFISEFTPVMGAHLGPGLLGLAFFTDV